MHVTFGEEALDDGAFPVEKIVDYYKTTGKLPGGGITTHGEPAAFGLAGFSEV